MNKGWWEAVHWSALMVPYSGVNLCIRPQVSGKIEEEGQFQVTPDKHLTKSSAKTLLSTLCQSTRPFWDFSSHMVEESALKTSKYVKLPQALMPKKIFKKLLVDEPGDDFKLWQLLLPGLRPNIVCWYVSSPVDPVPRSCSGDIFQ